MRRTNRSAASGRTHDGSSTEATLVDRVTTSLPRAARGHTLRRLTAASEHFQTSNAHSAFGKSDALTAEPFVAAAALVSKRPVRLEYSRFEDSHRIEQGYGNDSFIFDPYRAATSDLADGASLGGQQVGDRIAEDGSRT